MDQKQETTEELVHRLSDSDIQTCLSRRQTIAVKAWLRKNKVSLAEMREAARSGRKDNRVQQHRHLNAIIEFNDALGFDDDVMPASDVRGTGPMQKKHLFLSYCRDNQGEVAKLREELIVAGETVWWDQDILPGQDWKQAIRQAIKDCYAVVLCLSKEVEGRDQSGLFPEALDAIAEYRQYAPGTVFLIPVRLSACEIPPFEIDANRLLDRLQCADLFPPSKRSSQLQRLVSALRAAPDHP